MQTHPLFQAARKRIERVAELRNTYVEVEFDPSELAPPVKVVRTIGDMVRECVDVIDEHGNGARGVRQELAK